MTKISSWLCSNKLTLNSDKTTIINFTKDRSASNLSIDILDFTFQPKPFCNYLGVTVDDKLKFFHHIQNVQSKLGRHCGVISKMRHYVPRSILLKYYMSNIKPIIQYGMLVYGSTSFSFLNPILNMQRKIVCMICFKRKFDTITKFFSDSKILTVHELNVYDLMKFCLQSLNQKHPTCFLNSLFTFKNFAYYTRISKGRTKNLLKKKKNSVNHEELRNIKMFEDLSAARVNFLKIMKSGERIQSTWTRERTIFFSFGKQTKVVQN